MLVFNGNFNIIISIYKFKYKTRTHTHTKPIPVHTGMGFHGYRYGFSEIPLGYPCSSLIVRSTRSTSFGSSATVHGSIGSFSLRLHYVITPELSLPFLDLRFTALVE